MCHDSNPSLEADAMDATVPSNEAVLDEARWPRLFTRLRRGGWGSACGCRGCPPCQRSARRYLRGLMRLSPQRAHDQGWRLIVARDAVPRVVDLEPVRPEDPMPGAGDEPAPATDGVELADGAEPQDEIRGPIRVRIAWTAAPVALADVAAHRKKGGVYLLVNAAGAVLKAGEGSFADRAAAYRSAAYQARSVGLRPAAMYLGTLEQMGATRDCKQMVLTTERVLSRTVARLQSAGKLPLPSGAPRPVPLEGQQANIQPSDVVNHVVVDNALPAGLVRDVSAAYGPGAAHRDATQRRLVLTTAQSQWEA